MDEKVARDIHGFRHISHAPSALCLSIRDDRSSVDAHTYPMSPLS